MLADSGSELVVDGTNLVGPEASLTPQVARST